MMTSLPTVLTGETVLAGRAAQVSSGAKDSTALLQAFRSFAKVAGSLERSYGQLQCEVERLRRALAEKDGELARNVEDKRNERARLLRIVEGLPCGVLVVFDTGKIWKGNPEALRLLSAAAMRELPESVAGLPETLRELFTSVQKEGGEREIRIAENAIVRWMSVRYASLGEGLGVFTLRDVTEHKCLEEAEARLKRDQALAELSAILAHEVRNPLASLELFAGLLAEAQLGREERRWIEQMRGGLRSLAATVNNVLQFHSPAQPDFSELAVGRLLEWVVDFCGPLADEAGVLLSMQNRVAKCSLRGDRHRLEQVLLNLVLNSIRATPGGGWIQVSGQESRGGEIELVVADTGRGIPAECLSRIFDPGFSTRSGSAGLGLAVCRRIVEQHGGNIQVETSPERGTCFRLRFPLAPSQEARG